MYVGPPGGYTGVESDPALLERALHHYAPVLAGERLFHLVFDKNDFRARMRVLRKSS